MHMSDDKGLGLKSHKGRVEEQGYLSLKTEDKGDLR